MADEGITVYPTAALRKLVEERYNADLPPHVKRREMEMLSEQVSAILGSIGQYIGSLERQEQSEGFRKHYAVAEARQNADIREQMLKRGLASEEELDKRGYVSHERLDQAEQDGEHRTERGGDTQAVRPGAAQGDIDGQMG